jgi:hypothetical protein
VSTLRGEAQVYALARCGGVPRGWATAATLPVLLDGFEIEDEHLVMTETLFMFLVMGARALILRRGRMRWRAALAAGVPAGCAVDVGAEGLPVLVLSPPPCCCAAFGLRGVLAVAVPPHPDPALTSFVQTLESQLCSRPILSSSRHFGTGP